MWFIMMPLFNILAGMFFIIIILVIVIMEFFNQVLIIVRDAKRVYIMITPEEEKLMRQIIKIFQYSFLESRIPDDIWKLAAGCNNNFKQHLVAFVQRQEHH